jgi:chemotaxis protein MotB
MMGKNIIKLLLVGSLLIMSNGCVAIRTNNTVPHAQDRIIQELEDEVNQLNRELYDVQKQKNQELMRLKQMQDKLRNRLQEEIGQNQAAVTMSNRGLVIQFLSQVFFKSGMTSITKKGKESLAKVVPSLKKINRELRIEGHTDNEPVKRTKFLYASNWELSSARALTVLDYFLLQGINPRNLSSAAYGEYRPVASNTTKNGRQKNRRVEIVVIPKMFAEKEMLKKKNLLAKKAELFKKHNQYIK